MLGLLDIPEDNQEVKFKIQPEEYLPHNKFTLPTRRKYLNASIY
jgi:hypothetical protein